MGNCPCWASLLARQFPTLAGRLARSAKVLNALAGLIFDCRYFFVVIVQDDCKHFLRAGGHAFPATVTLAGINTYVPIARAVSITIISNVTQGYPSLL